MNLGYNKVGLWMGRVPRAAGKVSKGGAAGPGFEPWLSTLASRKATPKVALTKKKLACGYDIPGIRDPFRVNNVITIL